MKLKSEIRWRGGLLYLSGLPHLPEMSPKVELWTSRTKGRAPTNCAIHVLALMWAVACFYSCRGILCIHPSFRIIGLAEPPVVGGSSQQQWLNSELLSMFLFHHVRPLSKQEEAQVIYEMVNTHETLHCAKALLDSRHFVTSPLVSPPNDVWETSAEIPSWWRVTTQIWVVLLIGWGKFPLRHDQSEAFPRSV